MLMYIQSTVIISSNGYLLTNIIEGDRHMNIRKNSGVSQTNLIGVMKGYPKSSWYYPKGISNILSMAQVGKHL